jgi:hypothetical protein
MIQGFIISQQIELSQQTCIFAANCSFTTNHSFDDFKKEITHDPINLIDKDNTDSHDLTPMIS